MLPLLSFLGETAQLVFCVRETDSVVSRERDIAIGEQGERERMHGE